MAVTAEIAAREEADWWRDIASCPLLTVVRTKLDDAEHGARNVDTLAVVLRNGQFYLAHEITDWNGHKRGRYKTNRDTDLLRYIPTHWRPLPPVLVRPEWSAPAMKQDTLDLRRGMQAVSIDAVMAAATLELREIIGLRRETAGAFLLGLRERLEK